MEQTQQQKILMVSQILDSLKTINQDSISDSKGNVDFEKLKQYPQIIETITKLDEMGVTSEWLFNNGFGIAGMILGRFLKQWIENPEADKIKTKLEKRNEKARVKLESEEK